MKRYLLPTLIAFLLGSIAGYAGLLLNLHHAQESLDPSVHYAWYDWFMYAAWPGLTLARCFINPLDPFSRSFDLHAIALANGVVASLVLVLLFLLSHLIGFCRHKKSRESLDP